MRAMLDRLLGRIRHLYQTRPWDLLLWLLLTLAALVGILAGVFWPLSFGAR
jgi:hypothetical protein